MNRNVDHESIAVLPLGRLGIKRYMTDLLLIEQLNHTRWGSFYSIELWNEENFSRPLIGKFDCSWGVFAGDRICAFLIGSRPASHLQHIHRIATHPDFAQRGFSGALLKEALKQWAFTERTMMITAIVNERNTASISMFRKAEFDLLQGEPLKAYLSQKSAVYSNVCDHLFEDHHGIRYVVVFRKKAGLQEARKGEISVASTND